MGPAALKNVATLASSLYSSALDGAVSMQGAVHAFLDQPDETTLAAARTAWLDSRPAYLHTEGFRFSSGPIDGTDENLEGFINAWPLDESFIDSILAGADPITADLLHADNEKGGEKNISTGYHAVEYLLWGEDTSADGPGTRPATDFDDVPANTRIRTYLSVVTDLLVDDFGKVVSQWDPAGGAYAASFVGLEPAEGLRRVLTGLGTLSGGELFGQRMTVPYDTKDQEDEHSCFSDNTTEDHKGDVQSIRHIYLGLGADDQPVPGSLSELVAAVDPASDQRIRAALDNAVTATEAIPRPFDQAILGADTAPGRVAIKKALDAVIEITDSLVVAAQELGVQIGTDVP
jgi:putative iron-regulated protein